MPEQPDPGLPALDRDSERATAAFVKLQDLDRFYGDGSVLNDLGYPHSVAVHAALLTYVGMVRRFLLAAEGAQDAPRLRIAADR